MTISIKQLTFETIIGILDHERITPQRVVIDCNIDYDYDRDKNFINYAVVAELIVSTMQQKKFELIETALEALIEEIHAKFSDAHTISLSITKPDILDNCEVCVSHQKSFL